MGLLIQKNTDIFLLLVPLGETNEEFYKDINTGQDTQALFTSVSESINNRNRHQSSTSAHSSTSMKTDPHNHRRNESGFRIPPPRPPPPKFLPLAPKSETPFGEWYCTLCTFLNHSDLRQCEQVRQHLF